MQAKTHEDSVTEGKSQIYLFNASRQGSASKESGWLKIAQRRGRDRTYTYFTFNNLEQ